MKEKVRIVSVDTGETTIAIGSLTTSLQGLTQEIEAGKILWGYLLTDEKEPKLDKSRWLVGIPTTRIISIGVEIEIKELEIQFKAPELKAVADE